MSNNENPESVSSEATFFIEADEVNRLVASLHSISELKEEVELDATHSQDGEHEHEYIIEDAEKSDVSISIPIPISVLVGDAALARLRVIFDKYLECSTLMDPHLERIVSSLSSSAKNIIHDIYNITTTETGTGAGNDNGNGNDNDTSTEENKSVEQENEKETETVETIIDANIQNLKRHLSAIYAISKVRGRKHIKKFLPHDAADVEPVLVTLRLMEHYKDYNQNYNSCGFGSEIQAYAWESMYTLLLWLGMLSLVPFDLNTIDSSLTLNHGHGHGHGHAGDNGNDNDKMTLISSMLATAQKHLSDAGATREAAASSLASLLSRPDLEQAELEDFVMFSNDVLKGYLRGDDGTGNGKDVSVFLVMGVIQTLATIFKTGSRSNLMERHLRCVEMLWEQAILVAEKAQPQQSSDGFGSSDSSGGGSSGGVLVLRKLLVKLFARVGCSYLPPKIASWRYQRGRRSLLENLENTSNENETGNADGGKSGNGNGTDNAAGLRDRSQDDSDLFDVPDQVEDSMAQLIQALTDPATTVRWSAAKGIGRVSERLPAICADDILDAILELCNDEENDNAWHGACLSLAELARRGLLLPKRLGEVIPIAIRAIQYDIPRGQHSVGSHVRDAACYTCWAFARAYAPNVLKPYVPELSKAIVVASLFDREINCRRAASASFQECVGRQGADNFKHGIAILTAADYFSLGNKTDAYTTVARQIAQFLEYREAIISHLYEEKLFHWDPEIRDLSSVSLRGLATMEPAHFAKTVLPCLVGYAMHENLFVRHGAVIGVAEIVLALGGDNEEGIENTGSGISEELIASISDLVFAIEKARLYRGRGGEIMRAAVSRLIECMALAQVPMNVKQQIGLLDSLDANLKHPNEIIQVAASSALYSLMRSYFPVRESGPSERLQSRVVDKYVESVRGDENPAATRGYSLALGYLPAKLLAPTVEGLDAVIDCLCVSSHPSTLIGGQGDAETRRNSIKSLVRICQVVGVGISADANPTYPTVAMDGSQVMRVFKALFDAVEDYNTDRRGDVGSWSRIEAMKGMEALTYLVIKASNIPHTMSCGPEENENTKDVPCVPSIARRLRYLEADVSTRVRSCLSESKPFRQFSYSSTQTYFDDELVSKVLSSILKQLSEKLDAVRGQAGSCLERMLSEKTSIIVPFVPSKALLLEALRLNDIPLQHNWSNPAVTFPLMMKAINIEAFFESILAGMIISVGGLTESITKSSSKALMDYMRALHKIKAVGKIAKIGHGLIKLFDKHTKDGRVILPLLVTVDKLLSHGLLDAILVSPTNDFSKDLSLRVRREASRCNDIKRLMAIVPVALSILHCEVAETQNTTLLFLMRLLAHKFPRVRRHTAEQLYIKLVEDESVVPNATNIEAGNDLLSQASWDRELGPPGNVRAYRNQVANFLGIELSEKDLSGPVMKKVVKVKDDFESYASLVSTAGR